MPFTISHAGFVLPLRRRLSPHVLCGLMIGSIVPDFPYFVRAFGLASFAHTIPGALCVSLPVGFFVYLLVRLTFRRIAGTLPKPHSRFLASWGINEPEEKRNLLAVTAAILAGALAHNFVDSFTHASGVVVSIFPVLSKAAFHLDGEPFHVFRILQHFGSALGMAMIVAAYWSGLIRHCRSTGCRIWQDSRSWLSLFGLTTLTMLIAAALNAEFLPGKFDFYALRVFGFKFLITWLPIMGVTFLCFATWGSRTPKTNYEQTGPGQPSTRPQSDSKSGQNSQSEAEGHSG